MGNCLVLQAKEVVRLMKMNGEILEYQTPIQVHQVLSEFRGHAISDNLPVYRYFEPDTELLSNHLYYLLPSPLRPSILVMKPKTEQTEVGTSRIVRIKVVMTKNELKEMLSKGGVSDNEMVSRIRNKQRKGCVDDGESLKGWKPVLESIPESEGVTCKHNSNLYSTYMSANGKSSIDDLYMS